VKSLWDDFLTEQRGRFALFTPVFMAAGILAYFARTTEPPLAWSAAVAGLSILLVAGAWRWPVPRAAALSLAFGCSGFALACWATARAPDWAALPPHAVVVSGQVSLVEALPEGRRITIASPSLDGDAPLDRALRIRLRTTDPGPVAVGDVIRVRVLLRAPSPPDYPGGWDTQREAFFSGLAGYGFAIGPATVLHHAGGGWWAALRSRVAQRIMEGLPGPQGAIAATLLTGMGAAIPPADRAAFQDSGLAHLLAVAGLHVGIVMGLVFSVARFGLALWERAALRWPTRQIAALAALAAGGLYLALTGAHVPILRSFAMAALVTLGVLTGRRAVSLRGLCLAALVLMTIAPASVVGVSFQMSFASVLTLIAGYEMARPLLARLGQQSWWRRPVLYVTGLMLTSLLAGTAALPFAAYHFGRATLYYVPANMLAVPLTAFWVMPCGLAVLALMPLGLEQLGLVPMGWGLRGLLAIAHTVSTWPAASLPVPSMPGWGLALVSVGLAWGGLWRGRLRLAGLLPLVLGLAAPLLVPPPDILVGPEARLIALRLPGRILIDKTQGVSAFEAEAAGRVWSNLGSVPRGDQPVGCTANGCRLQIAGRTVLLARDAGAVACDASVILSSAWLRGACPGVTVIDHGSAARNGATTLRLTPHAPVIVTDRMLRGDRPWVIRTRVLLPMAQTE
jgi:competence protein ComEC